MTFSVGFHYGEGMCRGGAAGAYSHPLANFREFLDALRLHHHRCVALSWRNRARGWSGSWATAIPMQN